MKLIIVKNYEDMSQESAQIFIEQIKRKPDSVLGLATGQSPERMYELLIEANKKGVIDFSQIKTFNLDEYVGISKDHPMSYHTFMNKHLFSKINIDKKNTHIPLGNGDIKNNGKQYDSKIENIGGIDLQILGIGNNAHIAFNEPGSFEKSGTGVVNLTNSTIEANSRYFSSKNDVPKTAITMGIGTILKAKKIILIASGKAKAEAIKNTFESEVSSSIPSSFLQNHRDVTIIVDEEAASLLTSI